MKLRRLWRKAVLTLELRTKLRVGILFSGATSWPGTVGNVHVDQVTNDNGERFLNTCQSLGLCIADTWFPRRDVHHWTWYSNDGRTKKALDHIAISARWRSAVTNCRVYRGATLGNTDHRILIATLRVRLKAEKSRRQASKFDSSKLQDPDIAESFSVDITNRFTALAHSQHENSENWETFKAELHASASTTLRRERCPPRRPWISPESFDLVEKRRKARLDGNMREYRRLNHRRNRSLKADRERYWSDMADVLETAAARNDSATVYRTLRDLRDEPKTKTTQVKTTQGEILTTKEDNRWKEHFSALLNCPLEQPDPMLEYAENHPESSPPSSVDPITVPEVKLHIKKLHNRRAPGICCITAEMLKKGDDTMAHWLTLIFNAIWNSEVVPDDWSKGVILPFWKRKGDA